MMSPSKFIIAILSVACVLLEIASILQSPQLPCSEVLRGSSSANALHKEAQSRPRTRGSGWLLTVAAFALQAAQCLPTLWVNQSRPTPVVLLTASAGNLGASDLWAQPPSAALLHTVGASLSDVGNTAPTAFQSNSSLQG